MIGKYNFLRKTQDKLILALPIQWNITPLDYLFLDLNTI